LSQLLSVTTVLTSALYIVLAIFVLLLMIMIHELGHYTAGKLLKFKINEFSVGFGKAIFQKTTKSGEKISLRLFPLGGYCAFEGEDEDDKDNPGAFNNQKPWKRLIVLFSGAFFNFISAILFSFIFLMSYGYSDRVVVSDIKTEAVGVSQLEVGDVIYAVNGEYGNFIYDKYFSTSIANLGDSTEPIILTIRRDGQMQEVTVYKTSQLVDVLDEDKNPVRDQFGNIKQETKMMLGVSTTNYRYGFFEALGHCFIFTIGWAWKVLVVLWQMITFQLSIKDLGGTVTTIVTIAEYTQINFGNLMLLLPLISVNLAVFNLLPFPALDGARMVFVGIEGIRKKPIRRDVEGTIHFVGLVILLAFVVVVDILHFVL